MFKSKPRLQECSHFFGLRVTFTFKMTNSILWGWGGGIQSTNTTVEFDRSIAVEVLGIHPSFHGVTAVHPIH